MDRVKMSKYNLDKGGRKDKDKFVEEHIGIYYVIVDGKKYKCTTLMAGVKRI